MFGELVATPGVVERVELSGRAGVMALHGGLESGTAEAAHRLAVAASASLYTVVQPDDVRWHVPSIHYDPAHSSALRDFLSHVSVAVSLHGFGRPGYEGVVLVGGSNRRLASSIAAAIRRRGAVRAISDLSRIPRRLRGMHPANPVNLPEFGGVQLEMSVEAREPVAMSSIVDAVATVLGREQRSLCIAGG